MRVKKYIHLIITKALYDFGIRVPNTVEKNNYCLCQCFTNIFLLRDPDEKKTE